MNQDREQKYFEVLDTGLIPSADILLLPEGRSFAETLFNTDQNIPTRVLIAGDRMPPRPAVIRRSTRIARSGQSETSGTVQELDEQPEIQSPAPAQPTPMDLGNEVIELPAPIVPTIPAVWRNMPTGEEIFPNDYARQTEWRNMNLTQMIPIEIPRLLPELGPAEYDVQGHRHTLSAYDRYMLAAYCHYFRNLPDIGFAYEAMNIIHRVYRASMSGQNNFTDESMQRAYSDLDDRGMVPILCSIGSVIFRNDVASAPVLTDAMTSADVGTLIIALHECNREIWMIYNVVGHYAIAGAQAIDPIPPFLQFNNTIQGYIDSVAQSTVKRSLSFLNFVALSRPESAQRGRYQPRTVTAPTGRPDGASASTPVPDSVANVADQTQDMTITIERPTMPLYFGATSRQGQQNAGPQELTPPPVPTPLSGTVPIVHSQEPNQMTELMVMLRGIKRKLDEVETKIDNTTTVAVQVRSDVRQFNQMFTTVIAQGSSANLAMRENINQVYNQVLRSSSAQNTGNNAIPIEIPRMVPVVSVANDPEYNNVVELLSRPGDNLIFTDEEIGVIHSYLSSHGRPNLTQGVNARVLSGSMARNQLKTIVRNLATRNP